MPDITRVGERHFQHRDIMDYWCGYGADEEKNSGSKDEEGADVVDGASSGHFAEGKHGR
jgi:hypothetical protein